MPPSSGGRVTHKRVGDDPQRARIVQGAYGTSVGYISEETGKWGYLIVTPDGRGAVAYAEEEQSSRIGSSLPQPREAVAKRAA